MASTGRAERRGQVGGRENCTLRRFKIRGLIEGMFRTVMGNIWWGESQSTGGHRCKRVTGQRSPVGQRKKTGQDQENDGGGGGYGGKREIEDESEKQGHGKAK